MIIEVKELCWVEYIKEEDMEKESLEKLTSIRTVIYQSKKDTILEALKDYNNNFDNDKVIESYDEFAGECLEFIKYLSISEVEE